MADSIPNYLPGMEPENIQNLLNKFFGEIDTQFPDKRIYWEDWNHARWDKAAGYLCTKLGYDRGVDFLKSYGYSVIRSDRKSIGVESNREEVKTPSRSIQSRNASAERNLKDEDSMRSDNQKNRVVPKRKNKNTSIIKALVVLVLGIVILGVIYSIMFPERPIIALNQGKKTTEQDDLKNSLYEDFIPIGEYIKSGVTDFSDLPPEIQNAIANIKSQYVNGSKKKTQENKQYYFVAKAIEELNSKIRNSSMNYGQVEYYIDQLDADYAGPYSSEINDFKAGLPAVITALKSNVKDNHEHHWTGSRNAATLKCVYCEEEIKAAIIKEKHGVELTDPEKAYIYWWLDDYLTKTRKDGKYLYSEKEAYEKVQNMFDVSREFLDTNIWTQDGWKIYDSYYK